MRMLDGIRVLTVLVVVATLAVGGVLAAPAAGKAAPGDKTAKAETSAATAGSHGKAAEKEAGARAAAERKKIIEEAVTALARVNLALRHLDRGKNDEALDDLAVAVGKLELIVTRYPELSLAPVDVRVITHDLRADVSEIRKAVDRAREALDEGRVQEARRTLRDLGSEIIVRVINIPLATWPAAIKQVVPLIDDGKIDQAKEALQAALSTLVVVDTVIPLPVVRAEAWLERASELAKKEQRTKDEERELADYLEKARHQLELAEALGYGAHEDYAKFYDTIGQIEKKTRGGGTETGLFDRLRRSIEEFKKKL